MTCVFEGFFNDNLKCIMPYDVHIIFIENYIENIQFAP